jgi:hypothetical protein
MIPTNIINKFLTRSFSRTTRPGRSQLFDRTNVLNLETIEKVVKHFKSPDHKPVRKNILA